MEINKNNASLTAYQNLLTIIKSRQEDEATRPYPPYSLHPTTYNYLDVRGNALLHYAAASGDLDIVTTCLANGADPNQLSYDHLQPASIALQTGNISALQLLKDKGANFEGVHYYQASTEDGKNWVRTVIAEKIRPILQDPNLTLEKYLCTYLTKERLNDHYASPLVHATEIGDIELVKQVIQRFPDIYQHTVNGCYQARSTIPLAEPLTVVAARSGQLELLQFLVSQKADLNVRAYTSSPLHAAIQQNQQAVIDYLLPLADLNAQDTCKRTPLIWAIKMHNMTLARQLIEKNVDLSLQDVDDNTILHYAVYSNDIELVRYLLTRPEIQSLCHQENIYGFTPLTVAMWLKADNIITLLDPTLNLETVRQSKAYGNYPTLINQLVFIPKIHYYNQSMYGDPEYNSPGYCWGLANLYELYGEERRHYFYHALSLLSKWDGSQAELDKPISTENPEGFYHPTLNAFLRQWCNDMTWYQHPRGVQVEIDHTPQSDLNAHYAVAADEAYQPVGVFLHENKSMHPHSRTPEQIQEILSYLLKLPPEYRVTFNGSLHGTSLQMLKQKAFYYDPNFKFETTPVTDVAKLLARIINYKYILCEKMADQLDFRFRIFHYQKDKDAVANFRLFKDEELPKTKDEALTFTSKSPNSYTPLHLAIITRSLPDIKKILADGFVDIHKKDARSNTAFDYALSEQYKEAIQLIIADPHFDYWRNPYQFDYVTNHVSTYGFKLLMDKLNLKKDRQQLIDMVFTHILLEGEKLFEELMKKCKGSSAILNAKDYKGNTPLFKAIIEHNTHRVKALLAAGASPNVCLQNQNTVLIALLKAKDHAERYQYIDLLLSHKADPTKRGQDGRNALELVRESKDAKLMNIFQKHQFFKDEPAAIVERDINPRKRRHW